MPKLLIATTNPGKLKEIQLFYADTGLELKSSKDFSTILPPEEDGTTFEENAVLKAKYYFEKTGLPVIADDGGLEVEALGGFPGAQSRRFLGYDASDRELAIAIIERLTGLPREKRRARLGCVLAFYDGVEIFTTASFVEGWITDAMPQEIESGFPYRSILVVGRFDKLYKDLTYEEHLEVNHRRRALLALKPKILERLCKK